MLIRNDPAGPIAIAQPNHAWVSGQLARAWGNERFGPVEPWEEVCLGAEQHDLGWADWEQRPSLHPTTGLPRRFFELPTGEHVGIWRNASQRMLTQSRYAALLTSLHVSGLYERHDYVNDTPEEAQAARDFLASERAFQERLLASLASDPRYTAHVTAEVVRRNRRLIATWDALSLLFGTGKRVDSSITNVPSAADDLTLTVSPVAGSEDRWTVSPWPFQSATVSLRFEGRRVPTVPIEDESAWQSAYAAAQWVSVDVTLSPNLIE
jgi:hypothetical protein